MSTSGRASSETASWSADFEPQLTSPSCLSPTSGSSRPRREPRADDGDADRSGSRRDDDDDPERPRAGGGGRPPRGWPLISSVTFMSGTRHSDIRVEYVLDTATWIGPWARTRRRRDASRSWRRSSSPRGCEAEAFADLRPGAVVEADLQRDGQQRSPR